MAKQIFTPEELRYLKLLAQKYPTVQAASTEIINLQAILNLPKGTEHFVSDVHGEYEAFLHILNSASGVVREKLDDLFAATVSKAERDQLATLIYYPKEKLEEIIRRLKSRQMTDCIVVEEKVSKEALKKYGEDTVNAVGATWKQSDVFGYEVNIAKLEQIKAGN